MRKTSRKAYAAVYLLFLITALLWLYKGWKVALAFFIVWCILAQLRVLIFVKDRRE